MLATLVGRGELKGSVAYLGLGMRQRMPGSGPELAAEWGEASLKTVQYCFHQWLGSCCRAWEDSSRLSMTLQNNRHHKKRVCLAAGCDVRSKR